VDQTNAVKVDYRIPFLVERKIGDIIDFDDDTIVLVDVCKVVMERRCAIQPPNIAWEGVRVQEVKWRFERAHRG
jgi:hypothetical protein